jgi:hypothetical protein
MTATLSFNSRSINFEDSAAQRAICSVAEINGLFIPNC